jgi:hypothetical protein
VLNSTDGLTNAERTSRAAMCEGKPGYTTGAKAWDVLQHRNSRFGKKRRNPSMEAYHCPHCGLWHIGSKNRG